MINKKIVTYLIALVWFVNGFFCKVLNLVPRHQEIVGRILGIDYAPFLTRAIGISEIFMAIWILSGIKTRFNALAQMSIIATMNVLEFSRVPDLLLWGKMNIICAFVFIGVIYFNEFGSNQLKKSWKHS